MCDILENIKRNRAAQKVHQTKVRLLVWNDESQVLPHEGRGQHLFSLQTAEAFAQDVIGQNYKIQLVDPEWGTIIREYKN